MKVEFGEGEGKVPLDAIAERAKKYQPKPKIIYKMIQEYVEKKYGFKVHTAYIAEVKRSLGLWERLHNPDFKPLEFEGFKKQAGLNAFTLSPQK